MESGETRTERRGASENRRAGRSLPAPDLLDIFPSQRSRRAADALAEVAAERARDRLEYERRMWKLDIEQHRRRSITRSRWRYKPSGRASLSSFASASSLC